MTRDRRSAESVFAIHAGLHSSINGESHRARVGESLIDSGWKEPALGGRECLAVSAQEMAPEPDIRSLRRLEPPRRTALARHVHQTKRSGQRLRRVSSGIHSKKAAERLKSASAISRGLSRLDWKQPRGRLRSSGQRPTESGSEGPRAGSRLIAPLIMYEVRAAARQPGAQPHTHAASGSIIADIRSAPAVYAVGHRTIAYGAVSLCAPHGTSDALRSKSSFSERVRWPRSRRKHIRIVRFYP